MRFFCDSATWRAFARISSALPLASDIIARCSSSIARASARALSASSRASRIRWRRSSIIFWIAPKAKRLSTKNVTRKQRIVQIISPGRTWISWLAARTELISLDEDVREDRAEQAVEHDRLGQGETD